MSYIISEADKKNFEEGAKVLAINMADFGDHLQVIKGDDGLAHEAISSSGRVYSQVVPTSLRLDVLNLTMDETKELLDSPEHKIVIYRSRPGTKLTRAQQIAQKVALEIEITCSYVTGNKEDPFAYHYDYKYLNANVLGRKVEISNLK